MQVETERAGIAILISDKTHFEPKIVRRYIKDYYIIQVSVINIWAPSMGTLKCIE